jgi:hypothetical protein
MEIVSLIKIILALLAGLCSFVMGYAIGGTQREKKLRADYARDSGKLDDFLIWVQDRSKRGAEGKDAGGNNNTESLRRQRKRGFLSRKDGL